MENLFKAKINLKYLRFLLKRNTRLMILVSVLMFALYPLLVFTQYVLYNTQYDERVFTVGQVLLLLILVATIFIVPMTMFSYLNSKRNLDVYHALPITRKDLYLSTLISSVIVILIPFTLIYTLGSIYYVSVIPNVDVMLEVKQYIYTVALTLAILLPIIFAMMNTGTTVDGLLYSAMVHVLPAIGYGAYVLYGEATLLGFRAGTDQLFLIFSSPIFTIFDLNFNLTRAYPNLWLITIYWLIFALIATWGVLQLYKFRKSEKAEDPFTNKWFFPIITTVFTIVFQIFLFSTFVAFTSGRLLDFRTLLFPVTFTFVGYMVLDVIANRGFRHFLKGVLNFIIITAITLASFTLSTNTGGLGYVNNVPDRNDVKEVSVFLTDPTGLISTSPYSYSYQLFREYTGHDGILRLTDPDHIQTIIDTHQNILDQYKKYDYNKNIWNLTNVATEYPFDVPSYLDSAFEVRYTLKNGATLNRRYNINFGWTYDMLRLIPTEAVFNNKYPSLILNSYEDFRISDFKFADPMMTQSSILATGSFDAFRQAYKLDYLDKSLAQHLEGDTLVGYVHMTICNQGCLSQSFVVEASDTRTVAYLKSQGKNIEFEYVEDQEFILVLPDANERRSFFFISNNTVQQPGVRDDVDQNFTYIRIDQQQLNQLLPYLRTDGLLTKATGVIAFAPKIEWGVERMSPNVFLMLAPEAQSLIDQFKSEKPIQRINYYDLMYQLLN